MRVLVEDAERRRAMGQTAEVMIWTSVAVILTLAACTIGYAYRRMRGMDHPTPDELEMMGGGHGADEHGAAGHDVPSASPAHP